MAERFRKNPNTNDPRDTLRDLRQAGAIDDQTKGRLEDVLDQPVKPPAPDSINLFYMDAFSQIGTSRLRNLRRVVLSAPGNSLNIDDLARLDEIIKIARQAETQAPKSPKLKPAMPSRRRMLETIGWVLLSTAILGTGVYGYTERKRAAAINEVEKRGQEIMGRDFYGVDAVEKTFGIRLPIKKVPEIPFSQPELERAKELDQFLILRTDVGPNNIPLSEGAINWLAYGQTRNRDYYEGEPSRRNPRHITETPRPRWALVQKRLLHGSIGLSPVKGIEMIIDYLINGVFRNRPLPTLYLDAVNEFEKHKASFGAMTHDNEINSNDPMRHVGDIKDYIKEDEVDQLTSLKIIDLTLHRPSEAAYDSAVMRKVDDGILFDLASTLAAVKPEITSEGRIYHGILTKVGSYKDVGVRLSRLQ